MLDIMKKVISIFIKNFWNGSGQISSVIGIITAFLFWIWKPNLFILVPLPVLLLATILLVMLFWALGKTIHDLYTSCYDFSNPILKFIPNTPKSRYDGIGIIITKKFPWIYNSMIVSIYHQNGEIEEFIGIGEVIEIQNNNLVQILVIELSQKHLQHLKDGIGLKEIKIKPFTDIRYLRGILWELKGYRVK